MDGSIDEAVEYLRAEQRTAVEVEDRTIRLVEPVKGDPGLVVLRVLGVAQTASPVGAAAHGPGAVAAGVWRAPELYLARWLNGRRWIAGYRLTGASRLSDYVRTEGRVPTRLETGHWYDDTPEAVAEAFLEAGILLEDPPFPVPVPAPERTPPPSRPSRSTRLPSSSRADGRRRTSPPTARAPARTKAPAGRVCPSCQMRKAETQYVEGSDLCVDCR